MTHGSELSMLTAVIVSALVLGGALITLIGTLGLVRLRTFVERVHAPTLGTTLGMGLVLLASIVLASVMASRPVLHEIAIAVFMTVTTPVTFMLLFRAAVLRSTPADRAADGSAPDQESGSASQR